MSVIVVQLPNHPVDGIFLLLGYTCKIVAVPFILDSLQLARLVDRHKSMALGLLNRCIFLPQHVVGVGSVCKKFRLLSPELEVGHSLWD